MQRRNNIEIKKKQALREALSVEQRDSIGGSAADKSHMNNRRARNGFKA